MIPAYREQIRKHFGVNLPQALSNMCTYIGGISRNLDISEVVNNNLATEEDTAVIAGKGVGQEIDVKVLKIQKDKIELGLN